MRARLNLASDPLGNTRRFFAVAVAVGLPAMVLFGMLCRKVVNDRSASGVRREEVTRIEKEMAGYRAQRKDLDEFFSDPGTRAVTQRAAFLNTLIDERSFPWTQFFLDLEHRLPGGVRVISLSPNLSADRVQVRMRVGAVSDKSKLEFLKALETSPEFSAIEVVSETRPGKSNENHDVVEMDLNAEYHAAPVETASATPADAPADTGQDAPATKSPGKRSGKTKHPPAVVTKPRSGE
jgi:Tfp pilus assembly protein PilN